VLYSAALTSVKLRVATSFVIVTRDIKLAASFQVIRCVKKYRGFLAAIVTE